MSVSESIPCDIFPLPSSKRGSGLPVATLDGQASVDGNGTGGAATIELTMDYSYAVMPLWVSAIVTGGAGSIQIFMSWDTSRVGKVSGVEIQLAHIFPFASASAGLLGYSNCATWKVPPYIYIPDEGIQATHRVRVQAANPGSTYALAVSCAALLFDPEDLRTAPASLLNFYLGRG